MSINSVSDDEISVSDNEIKVAFYNNPKVRSLLYQALVIAVLGFVVAYTISNLFSNIENRGIKTGFEFLSSSANFGISPTLIEFSETDTIARVFLVGLLNTILVSFVGIVFATVLGFAIGIARISSNFIISKLATIYVEMFRNIPILLQIFFWYNILISILPSPRNSISFFDSVFLNARGIFVPSLVFNSGYEFIIISIFISILIVYYIVKRAKSIKDETGKDSNVFLISIAILVLLPLSTILLMDGAITLDVPRLKGFNFTGGMSFVPEFTALAFALAIYTATYIAEAVRSGIEAVSKGQKEAATSLGLKKSVILRKVVIPQAMRVIIPPVINQYLNLTKNSSLATAIGYPEIVTVFAGTALNNIGQAVEIMGITMATYLLISIFISVMLNVYNKKVAIKER